MIHGHYTTLTVTVKQLKVQCSITNPFIFCTVYTTQSCEEPGAYTRGHPGQDSNPMQGTISHTLTHYGQLVDMPTIKVVWIGKEP